MQGIKRASWKEPVERRNTVFYVDLEEWEAIPGIRCDTEVQQKMGAEGRERRRLTRRGRGEQQGRSGGLFPQGKNAFVQ